MLRECKDEGISTAVDTCGFVPWENIQKTLGLCDTYLYDIKCADSRLHKAFTGQENERILENFRKLSAASARIWIRIPVIPGFNDSLEDAAAFALLLKEMDIFKVQLLPFHRLGCHKYELLGLAYDYADTPSMQAEELSDYSREFTRTGIEVII